MACFGSPMSTSVVAPGERPAQDLPLHRVGVLELVDEHHRSTAPAGGRRPAGPRSGSLQHAREQPEQVVVVAHARPALAPLELVDRGPGQPHALPGGGGRVGVRGLEPGLPVADRRARDHARVTPSASCGGSAPGAANLRTYRSSTTSRSRSSTDSTKVTPGSWSPAMPSPSSTDEQKLCVVTIVARSKSDSAAHQAPPALGELVVGHRAQVLDQRVAAGRSGQPAQRDRQPLAHPLAQLLGGRAAEGRQHQLRQVGDALGDVAGGERRDGPGLAGAGARLEHGRARSAAGRTGRSSAAPHGAARRLAGQQRRPQPPGERAEAGRLPPSPRVRGQPRERRRAGRARRRRGGRCRRRTAESHSVCAAASASSTLPPCARARGVLARRADRERQRLAHALVVERDQVAQHRERVGRAA